MVSDLLIVLLLSFFGVARSSPPTGFVLIYDPPPPIPAWSVCNVDFSSGSIGNCLDLGYEASQPANTLMSVYDGTLYALLETTNGKWTMWAYDLSTRGTLWNRTLVTLGSDTPTTAVYCPSLDSVAVFGNNIYLVSASAQVEWCCTDLVPSSAFYQTSSQSVIGWDHDAFDVLNLIFNDTMVVDNQFEFAAVAFSQQSKTVYGMIHSGSAVLVLVLPSWNAHPQVLGNVIVVPFGSELHDVAILSPDETMLTFFVYESVPTIQKTYAITVSTKDATVLYNVTFPITGDLTPVLSF